MRYDAAQICLNGHVINTMALSEYQYNENYCSRCGAETIMTCPTCGNHIRGEYHDDVIVYLGHSSNFTVPKFCHNCGSAYPWTEAQIEAAKEMIHELEELSDNERDLLSKSIIDIATETPRTDLAVIRFKKAILKLAPEAKQILINTVSTLACEYAKKQLGL